MSMVFDVTKGSSPDQVMIAGTISDSIWGIGGTYPLLLYIGPLHMRTPTDYYWSERVIGPTGSAPKPIGGPAIHTFTWRFGTFAYSQEAGSIEHWRLYLTRYQLTSVPEPGTWCTFVTAATILALRLRSRA